MNTQRPTNRTVDLLPVVESLASDVHEWCNDGSELSEIKEHVAKLLKDNYATNGYEYAKEMEDMGYYPDSDLVEIFNDVDYRKYECLNDAYKKWVKENNIKPKLSIGQKVKVKSRDKTRYSNQFVGYRPKDGGSTARSVIKQKKHIKVG